MVPLAFGIYVLVAYLLLACNYSPPYIYILLIFQSAFPTSFKQQTCKSKTQYDFNMCDVSSRSCMLFYSGVTLASLFICPVSSLAGQACQEMELMNQTLAAREESDAKAVTFYAGHCSTVFGIRCILQIDSFPAFVITSFLFPQAAELRSSKTSLFLSCFCCVRCVFDLSGHCNDMQAFWVICPLSKQARQEIDDLKQTLAAKEESDAKAVTFYAGHFPTVFGIRCILQIDSFPAFVVTIFLFPQAAELRSSKTSLFFILFLLCATCLRPFWSLQ